MIDSREEAGDRAILGSEEKDEEKCCAKTSVKASDECRKRLTTV